MGINSIQSLYEYGKIRSNDELNSYNSDKEPKFIHPLDEKRVNNHYTYCKQNNTIIDNCCDFNTAHKYY